MSMSGALLVLRDILRQCSTMHIRQNLAYLSQDHLNLHESSAVKQQTENYKVFCQITAGFICT